jgi:DNA polymerase-3 subunit delta
MNDTAPIVYLSYGDDEFEIEGFANKLKAHVKESGSEAMNVTRLEENLTFEALTSAVNAMPFLADRRMVIVENPLSLARSTENRDRFLEVLEQIPPTTACLVNIYRPLKNTHWLLKWARKHPDRVHIHRAVLPKGKELGSRIQKQAQQAGGEITPRAAARLAALSDGDPRLAAQEVKKLLTYVNLQRPVTEEDVNLLSPDVRLGDVFEMVDAIGLKHCEQALQHLHRQLNDNHPLALFSMIIRQFRLLLLVKELQDENPGLDNKQIAKIIGQHPYPVKKIMRQTRFFTLPELEEIYHLLSEVDEAIKSSEYHEDSVLLDLLIINLTTDLDVPLTTASASPAGEALL